MSIKNIFNAQILTNTNGIIAFIYRVSAEFMNLFKSCTSKMNTAWVGLHNVYGNILSHKMTWFTVKFQVFTHNKNLIKWHLNHFYEKGQVKHIIIFIV